MAELVASKRKKNLLPIIIAIIAAVVAIVVIVLVVNSKSVQVNRHFNAAEKYMAELDYVNAVAEYKTIIKIDPKNVDAYIGLAEVYLAMDDSGSAIEVLEDGYRETESETIMEKLDELMILQEEAEQNGQKNNPDDSNNDDAVDDENAPKYLDSSAEIGDAIVFGNDTYSNEWIVLDKDGNKLLLINDSAVIFKEFNNEEDVIVTWDTCSLRTWLNNEYLYTAFSDDERAVIYSTTVVTNDNEYSGRSGGAATDDYIFLLSLEEVNRYFDSDNDRILLCNGTFGFVGEDGSIIEVEVDNERVTWWLRTPGNGYYGTSFVEPNGLAINRQSWVNYETLAVRPVMWVDVSEL